MDWSEFWNSVQALPLSEHIGFTAWFPFLESLHVLAVGLVVGSILMVDLRLLNIAALTYPASRITKEVIPWTWGAFGLATITGVGMFMTRAGAYVENPAFQIKLILLVLVGVNMSLFQFWTFRNVESWDTATQIPLSARAAGITSLLLWVGIVFAGRWTGHII